MKYVVYTHTDYIDIINVHADHLVFDDNILVINKNNLILDSLYEKFQQVVFYDDRLPYAGRLYQSIKEINSEYIMLIHDMDILLDVNKKEIKKIYDFTIENSIDRIDLKQEVDTLTDGSIIIDTENFKQINLSDIDNSLYLVKSKLYNVNPSIWKKEALLDILFNFANETYRSIENVRVDAYCSKYNFYKLYNTNYINAGYFDVVPEFVFLHMTHGGGLMPTNYDKINKSVNDKYINIINKYPFNRNIKQSMW